MYYLTISIKLPLGTRGMGILAIFMTASWPDKEDYDTIIINIGQEELSHDISDIFGTPYGGHPIAVVVSPKNSHFNIIGIGYITLNNITVFLDPKRYEFTFYLRSAG